MNKSTFLKYIEEGKIGESIYNSLINYCRKHRKMVLEYINEYGFTYVNDVDDIYPNFKAVWIDEKGVSEINFDVILEVDLDCTGVCGKRHDHEDCSARIWFIVSCTGDLKNKLSDFKIKNIEEYNGDKTKLESPLTGDFVPLMNKDNYDEYANKILEKYYPEALKTPMAIDVDLLAERMGLKVVRAKIDENSLIFGQIYFFEDDVIVFDAAGNSSQVHVDKNTILIDDEANFLYSFGSRNMTVVHECVHFRYHYRAFLFAQMLDEQLKNISCKTFGGIDAKSTATLVRIEKQANALAPYILMPKDQFKQMAYDLIKDYGRIYGGNSLDHLPFVIEELASKFKVTKYAVRKRLIDIGITEAIGVINWVDDTYIRPYSFKKDSLKSNETFTISIADVSSQLLIQSTTLNILNTCGFVYVENHIVLNDVKYVQKNKKGELILTEYARFHLDECAVKFGIKYKNEYLSHGLGMVCYLCRDASKMVEFDISLLKNPNLIQTEEGSKKYRIHNKNIKDIISHISGVQFGEALMYLMEFLEMDESELADDADVSEKTISRYRSDFDKEKDKRTVVAIIRGLNVPYRVSEKLLESAGIVLTNGNELDEALRDVLLYFREASPYVVNEFLTRKTGKPLTKDKIY